MSYTIISRTIDCPIETNKRLTELNQLNFKELEQIVVRCGIQRYRLNIGGGLLTKDHLINGIILYENIYSGNKPTEIIINIDNQNKSYFINTISKFVEITKKTIENKEIYNIKNNITYPSSSTEISYENQRFSFHNHILQKHTNLYNDIKLCREAMLFIESRNFYFKVKNLLDSFKGINDIIRNICFVYFERTLNNISNIKFILK